MSFAIIRGSNGRRHDVDFGDAEIEVDVAIGSETVQITVEAIHDQAPSDKRRFATIAIPRQGSTDVGAPGDATASSLARSLSTPTARSA